MYNNQRGKSIRPYLAMINIQKLCAKPRRIAPQTNAIAAKKSDHFLPNLLTSAPLMNGPIPCPTVKKLTIQEISLAVNGTLKSSAKSLGNVGVDHP